MSSNAPLTVAKIKPDRGQLIVGAALILIAVFFAYLPVLKGEFLWDDDVSLTDNPLIKTDDGLQKIWFSTEPRDYFPLTYSVSWIAWRIWGANPSGYHFLNLVLHGLGAVLLWRVLVLLGVNNARPNKVSVLSPAWCAALVFALHPVCVASAGWITELKNTLSLVFFLLSIYAYLKSENLHDPLPSRFAGSKWYITSLIGFLLALLSKTSVVMLPLVLLLCVWWLRGQIKFRDLARTAPFFVFALVFGLITVWFQTHRAVGWSFHDSILTRCLAGSWGLWLYLWKAIFPINLCMIYPRWTPNAYAFFSYLPFGLWVGMLFLFWKKQHAWGKAPFFALSYFTLTLLPVFGFFNMSFFAHSAVSDHLQYLALIGPITLLTVGGINWLQKSDAKKAVKRNSYVVEAFVAVMIIMGCLTLQRAAVFSRGETLWSDNLKKNPSSWGAHTSLSQILASKGEFSEAEEHSRAAARLLPVFESMHYNLGAILTRNGKYDEAISAYQQAIRIKPDYIQAHNNLAVVFAEKENFDSAAHHFAKVLSLEPDNADVHQNLGTVLKKQGKMDEAARHFREMIRINPQNWRACNELALILAIQGRTPEALTYFENVIRLNPNWVPALNNLAWTYATNPNDKIRNPSRAVELASRACNLTPDSPTLLDTLAAAYAEEGRYDQAIATAEKSLALAEKQAVKIDVKEFSSRLANYKMGKPWRDN